MYAIIETGGKQYKVEEGMIIKVEKLGVSNGDEVSFENVLAVKKADSLVTGSPCVKGATVKAEVLEAEGKGKKIIVFKYKPKKTYKKKQGHRQRFTKVKITSINA
ncbi:50S ribosomal protein L21 [Candidatus Epulonipiscium viviparus]|uniref:50S ribosomal protein L21 n=1 Tax=Candidatus Epulonipiscium viviparus TaxID=420336 RepID=UPI00016BFDC4|nr:50S ribosomal protein L21 [Candidatus Epulopiscium viviparus]